MGQERTKCAVARISLSLLGWGDVELLTFQKCKMAHAHQATLSHRDDKKHLCVYTDAFDMVWSGIVTKVPPEDLSKPH